jgi:protein O-mannosyl-transferase
VLQCFSSSGGHLGYQPGSIHQATGASSSLAQAEVGPVRSSNGAGVADSTPPPRQSVADWLRNPTILLFLLGLLTFLLYIATLSFQFVWDDNFQIVHNPLIRRWHNVPRMFGSDLWHSFTQNQIYYRPLFMTWSTLNYTIFQLKAWGWHLGAVLMHILAVVSVFWLARKLGLEYWTAALTAMIFAFHPVHVECASWISAASDPMVTVFFALAIIAFVDSRQAGGNWLGSRILSILLLVCALFTKEMGVTVPAMVAVYVWLFHEPRSESVLERLREAIVAALPYGLVVGAYLLVRKFALHNVTGAFDTNHGVVEMLLTWPGVLYNYIKILVLPLELSGFYYTPYVEKAGARNFFFPALVLIATAVLLWYWFRRKRDPVVAFAGIWLLVTLAPVLYLRGFENGNFVHDRYIYLPSVGFAILLAKAIRLLPGFKFAPPKTLQLTASCVLALAYLAGSYYQEVFWSSELLISYRAHTLYPEFESATIMYADELNQRGGQDRAIELLTTTIKDHPRSPELFAAYLSLTTAYVRAKDLARAQEALARAGELAKKPSASAENAAYVARVYGYLADYDQAFNFCSMALEKDPNLYAALDVCGNVALLAGRYREAEKLLSSAILIAPERAAPRYLLGRVYFQSGRPSQAEVSFGEAVGLDADVYEYHYWYGRALAARGDVNGAQRQFLAALTLRSDATEAKEALSALAVGPRN